MIRDICGTRRGAIAHAAAREPQCGWCQQAERCARLAAEATARPPLPLGAGSLEPVSAERAALNRNILDAEVKAFDHDHPYGTRTSFRDDLAARRQQRSAA